MSNKLDNPTGEYLSNLTMRRPHYAHSFKRPRHGIWHSIHVTLVLLVLFAIFAIALSM